MYSGPRWCAPSCSALPSPNPCRIISPRGQGGKTKTGSYIITTCSTPAETATIQYITRIAALVRENRLTTRRTRTGRLCVRSFRANRPVWRTGKCICLYYYPSDAAIPCEIIFDEFCAAAATGANKWFGEGQGRREYRTRLLYADRKQWVQCVYSSNARTPTPVDSALWCGEFFFIRSSWMRIGTDIRTGVKRTYFFVHVRKVIANCNITTLACKS